MNVEKLMEELAKYPKDAEIVTQALDEDLARVSYKVFERISYDKEKNEVTIIDYGYLRIIDGDGMYITCP